VDTDLFKPNLHTNSNKITIGWEGVPRHHYGNLLTLKGPLERIAKEYDVRFKIVSSLGDLHVKKMFRDLEDLIEIDYGLRNWSPLSKLPQEMSVFDLMVAPLQNTLWCEGKSALRVGLGMAMGIPVIASPVGEQKYVIRHDDNGLLARNENDWYQSLKQLIEDGKLRRDMGRKGRETAEKELSLSVCANKLLDVINNSSK
jgi:glycosyltransferase involved in cell wall biosynthesis